MSSSKTGFLTFCRSAALMDDIINRPDPNGILEFLVNELAAAEKAGQRAWIFGHIPPGASDVMRDQVRNDISVSQYNSSLISGVPSVKLL